MPLQRFRRSWFLLVRTFRRIARSSGSAHSIALGAGIGFFVGMTPTMGIQMLIAAGIATLFRANRITAILPVWVTNPLTFIPIYVTCYKVGYWITGLGISIPAVHREIEALHAIQEAEGGYAAFRAMLNLSMEVLLSLTLGSFVVGTILGTIGYVLTYKLVLSVRRKLHEKRARRAARILQYREGTFSADLIEKESYESGSLPVSDPSPPPPSSPDSTSNLTPAVPAGEDDGIPLPPSSSHARNVHPPTPGASVPPPSAAPLPPAPPSPPAAASLPPATMPAPGETPPSASASTSAAPPTTTPPPCLQR